MEVLDLARGLAVSTVKLPEVVRDATRVAVTPDNTTLAVLTPSGVAVLAVGAATPLAPCSPPPRPPAGVLPVCGTLAEVVVDGTNHAFATNRARNQVEVVNLTTGALEAPIPVGSRPPRPGPEPRRPHALRRRLRGRGDLDRRPRPAP